MALLLVAVAGAFTARARRVPPAIWLTPVLFVVVTIPTLGNNRYRVPIEPFIVLLATLALDAGYERWRRERGSEAAGVATPPL